MNDYMESFNKWIKESSTEALESFVNAHMARIFLLGRDMSRAVDGDTQKAIRGQFSICYEEVDAVNAALAARKAEANAGLVRGIPNEG